MTLRIIEYYAENFKRIRLVNLKPTGRMTIFSGRNNQGKSSALDAIPFVLGGAKWSPDMPTRKGASHMKVKLDLGSFTVQRTPSGVTLQMAEGQKAWDSPQKMLDSIFDELAFDPMEFVRMKPKDQAEMLRRAVKLDVNLDQLAAESARDFEMRREVNREVQNLTSQISAITVQADLPEEKLNEVAAISELNEVGEKNRAISEAIRAKLEAQSHAAAAEQQVRTGEARIVELDEKIREITEQLRRAEQMRLDLFNTVTSARQAANELREKAEAMPSPEYADVSALTENLERIRLTNREIERRDRRRNLETQRAAKELEARNLTRAMEGRDEARRIAIANAKMPVEGLTFTDDQVFSNGIPIQQLGEAEQIRISVALVLARNPKLRLVRIPHGESLDEESLAMLAEMAEEMDFYVWMARVDTTGKIGIVLEDGEVSAVNENLPSPGRKGGSSIAKTKKSEVNPVD